MRSSLKRRIVMDDKAFAIERRQIFMAQIAHLQKRIGEGLGLQHAAGEEITDEVLAAFDKVSAALQNLRNEMFKRRED
jgi:hypothetical protein